MKVTICIVPYNNPVSFERVIKQLSVCKFPEPDEGTLKDNYEIIVIDNSKDEQLSGLIADICFGYDLNITYEKGKTSSLSFANNMAIKMANGEYFIYLCSNHTWIYDDLFIFRAIYEMDSRNAVMAGTINREVAEHVQGGIYIAKTEILRKFMYDHYHYPFSFMDVDISQRMIAAGEILCDIPCMYSTMKEIRIESHELWARTKEVAICHSHFYERLDKKNEH